MGTISETTAAASGEVGSGDLSCSRHQSARSRPRAGLTHRQPKGARWDRTLPQDRRTSNAVIALGRERAIIEARPEPITVDPPAVYPIPLFEPKPRAYVLGCSAYAAGVGLAEKFIYGILAGGAVLAVSGGLGWTGELVRHWPTFNAGIDKLLH